MYKSYSKYRSKKTEVDWIQFDSKLEARFYEFLRDAKDITLLDRQIKFTLMDKFRTKEWVTMRAITYVPDFYIDYHWDRYYIDSKWFKDPVFKIKEKLWWNKFGDENILLVCKSIKELKQMIDYE